MTYFLTILAPNMEVYMEWLIVLTKQILTQNKGANLWWLVVLKILKKKIGHKAHIIIGPIQFQSILTWSHYHILTLIYPIHLDSPWFTLIHLVSPWFILIHLNSPWFTLNYPDLHWFTLIYLDLPWSLIYLGPWFTLIHLKLPWFTLIYIDLHWFIFIYTDYLGLPWFTQIYIDFPWFTLI